MLLAVLAIFPSLIAALTNPAALIKAETLPPLAPDVSIASTPSDASILNFAQSLKYLSRALYASGLAAYNRTDFVAAGFGDPFYADVQQIYFNEQSHVSLLYAAVISAGGQSISMAEYDFPYGDVEGFVRLAAVVAGLEVSGCVYSLY